mmetsp:Transcript_35977/g.52730  ORF Transcript_35977/g.52730 Transcript_35977/m.52730 type:complete len:307 (-) Transcript_35977:433-1353(-)
MAEAKNDNATNNDNQSNNNDKETTTSSFLSSMTFASMRDCECDECDAACGMNFASLPSSIAEAITRHKKRLKLQDDVDEEEKKKKEQERSLVCRSREGISVWKWTLPMGAEPLIEYGNSHRIVFVEDIAKHAKIQSIGKGIIGSSEEERTRTNVSWNKQSAYIIKCNGGKALGFTQSSHAIIPPNDDDNDVNDDNNKKEGEEEKDVVLYIFKIMPKTLLAYDDGKKKKKKKKKKANIADDGSLQSDTPQTLEATQEEGRRTDESIEMKENDMSDIIANDNKKTALTLVALGALAATASLLLGGRRS